MRRTAGLFEDAFEEMSIIGIDDALARRAGELAELHSLRGFDAMHLAAGLELGPGLLVTWDSDLARAANRSGLAVLPPLVS